MTRTGTDELLDCIGGLNDRLRLRLMLLLDAFELSVGELASAVQSPQSTVSRHLKRLVESGWIQRRSVGPQALYRRVSSTERSPAAALWTIAADLIMADADHEEDLRRARTIIAARPTDSHAFFDTVGGEWTSLRSTLFGTAIGGEWLPAIAAPTWRVADLGCGTAQITAALAPWVQRIDAVDRELAMLQAARKRLGGISNVHFHEADLTELPLPKRAFDLVILSLVLHHVEQPNDVVQAAASLLTLGGRVLIIDMIEHQRAEYRDTMGHLHLGFDEPTIARWGKASSLSSVHYSLLAPDPEAQGPGLFAATLTASDQPAG
ncbi:MAG TPA: methyltransferase domain-containing protein [Phycisphaerales bacterium]|nr:methyltransferase domain-containing protein [Phycisphaerales bacterium]